MKDALLAFFLTKGLALIMLAWVTFLTWALWFPARVTLAAWMPAQVAFAIVFLFGGFAVPFLGYLFAFYLAFVNKESV